MDQIEKLLSGLTPATIGLIIEQVETYRDELMAEAEPNEDCSKDIAWCDRVLECGRAAIVDKSE